MSMFYYVDENGVYLGGWNTAQDSAGFNLVNSAPEDARQVWTDGAWSKAPSIDKTLINKLQAVRYFQNNGAWPQIKALISSDVDLQDRWDATSVLAITDQDVIAMASEAQNRTGDSLQVMFNAAALL